MTTQSPTLASQATAELPKLPEPLDPCTEPGYTADQVQAYGLACYEAGRASSAQSEWQPIGWQFRFVFPTHASNWKSVLSLPLNEKMAGPIPGIEAKYETRLVYAATLGETK